MKDSTCTLKFMFMFSGCTSSIPFIVRGISHLINSGTRLQVLIITSSMASLFGAVKLALYVGPHPPIRYVCT